MDARAAALSAGHTRIRPVDDRDRHDHRHAADGAGLGEGGEQNAPLGRAVIGGLILATITTLFVVPMVYSLLRTKPPVDHEKELDERSRTTCENELLLRGDLQ